MSTGNVQVQKMTDFVTLLFNAMIPIDCKITLYTCMVKDASAFLKLCKGQFA